MLNLNRLELETSASRAIAAVDQAVELHKALLESFTRERESRLGASERLEFIQARDAAVDSLISALETQKALLVFIQQQQKRAAREVDMYTAYFQA